MTFYSVLIRPGEEWTDLYEILLRKEPLSTENGKAPAEAGAFCTAVKARNSLV